MANKAEDYTDLDINALNAISNYVAPFLNASLQTDKAKREIYKLNDELEAQVLERTAKLKAANADLESFSYSLSHGLCAPLRAINHFSSILQEEYATKLDTESQCLFVVVSDNAKKMGKLIEDILFLSRASLHEMQISTVDIKGLVKEVWDSLEADWTGRVIEFRLADVPPILADVVALREVLQNLLANASKFTGGRNPAIIEFFGYAGEQEAIYGVRDNGTGFDCCNIMSAFMAVAIHRA